MDSLQWVLDTWVLATASDPHNSKALDALSLLNEILHKHSVVLDIEGEILNEYKRHLYVSHQTHVKQWWTQMQLKGKYSFVTSKLNQRPKHHLLNKLSFHSDDIKFVGVASNSKDKLLVSEDSHYTPEVRQYVYKSLRVHVMDLSEANDRARDP